MLAKTDVFESDLQELADLCKALAHPARLAIIQHLAQHESCICGEIVDAMPLAQATVSRHLKTLKEAGLIKGEIDGPRSCYCLDTDALARAASAMSGYLDEIASSAPRENCC